MKRDDRRWRVIKTLAPTDRGAVELARRHGKALLCVRHRTDAKGTIRLTTVELIVHRSAISPRPAKMVHVHVQPHERKVHDLIRAAGGRWDGQQRLWRIPSRIASILGLRDRIVDPEMDPNPHPSTGR